MEVAHAMIDVEALLTSFLRAQSSITALVGDRVYTDLPHKRQYPLLLVTRAGGGYMTNPPLWLEQAEVLFQAYGGTHKQAQTIASTCVDLLGTQLRGAHPQGSVTGFRASDVSYEPDEDLADTEGHSRPRFLVLASVFVHP